MLISKSNIYPTMSCDTFLFIAFFINQTYGYTLFWRSSGMKLNATLIDQITSTTAHRCLGACMRNANCRALNVHQEGNTSFCELFSEDKCSWEITISPDASVNYFDRVGDKECPFSKF